MPTRRSCHPAEAPTQTDLPRDAIIDGSNVATPRRRRARGWTTSNSFAGSRREKATSRSLSSTPRCGTRSTTLQRGGRECLSIASGETPDHSATPPQPRKCRPAQGRSACPLPCSGIQVARHIAEEREPVTLLSVRGVVLRGRMRPAVLPYKTFRDVHVNVMRQTRIAGEQLREPLLGKVLAPTNGTDYAGILSEPHWRYERGMLHFALTPHRQHVAREQVVNTSKSTRARASELAPALAGSPVSGLPLSELNRCQRFRFNVGPLRPQVRCS
jgi:hypothetical protein